MEREIRLLEFDKIRTRLAGLTITPMGRELAEDLAPATDVELCRKWLTETSEAVNLLSRHPASLEAVPDTRKTLELASRGAQLGEEQLFGVARLLNAVTKIKNHFREREGFPVLSGLVQELAPLPVLREELKKTLDEDGRMKDDASPELLRLRRGITHGERDLRERFERFVRNQSTAKLLQDALITVRRERLVVPVRQEYRSQVPGVVHDHSASGATLFIEPLWAVEANNRLAVLRREAEREKDAILSKLSQWAGAEKDTLYHNLNLYAELDFILAKGRLSLAMKGTEPGLNARGHIKIIEGRHPLLTGDVVPISLEMGSHLQTLVITGPNTGGKTVTLKTVGLFSIMAQSGLHIPAGEGTQMNVFRRIFADIGDEQNIEQSLSTFSGHLKNIIGILAQLEPGSLVLLDEVGAGTDPTEGAGLAMSILEYLHNNGAVTVATTHYSQLKTFAYLTEGMDNASVEFDVATLRPTYQLLVGVPGLSNAFAIASRLGLPRQIIDRGKEFLTFEQTRLEEVVADLVADRRRFEIASRQAESDRQRTETILAQLEREKHELAKNKADILNQARAEARETVVRARKEAEQLLKQLRRLAAETTPPAAEAVEEVAAKMKTLEQEIPETVTPEPLKRLSAAEVETGDDVFVNSLGQRGTVVQVQGEQVQVQVGPMRVTVEAEELSPAKPEKKQRAPEISGFLLYAGKEVPFELDLRGLTLDEAAIKVDTYLDEASLAGLKEVRLIHGKGTGRLRAGLKEYLQGHPRVESMRTGYPAQGGTGATVIELKN